MPEEPRVFPLNKALVRLVSECPTCHRREARRVAVWRLAYYREHNPELICETVICNKCGQEYPINAEAYQLAEAEYDAAQRKGRKLAS